ncbi:MAG: DNA-deoxyinosine glycosylase [Spirochaetaceae bacterium]|jgi:hypoxanthine-DNA glycosylase|nr:DNA-deoxyinosine glycosylase [Spirochaetaceae bacterium]
MDKTTDAVVSKRGRTGQDNAGTVVVHPFPPLCNAASRVLILGTMPSPASREQAFFYAHPRNRFWPVIAAVFDEPPPLTKEDRIQFALERNLAIWDVLASCLIDGAADHTIKHPEANDLLPLLHETKITRVFTTGSKAYALYTKLCLPRTGLPATPLPSTSPANQRVSFAGLVEKYRAIRTAVEMLP